MFKIQEKGKPETAIWLTKETIIISNDGKGDLSFHTEKPDVSKLKIQLNEARIHLADLTFNFSIHLNNILLAAGSKCNLKHTDTIRVGDKVFEIIDAKATLQQLSSHTPAEETPWQLQATGNWLDGQVFTLGNRTVIGRDNSCDIVIPGAHLSRRHAEFMLNGQTLLVRDLSSANGSYVNNKKISESTLKDGDIIKLDMLTFKVIAPKNSKATHNPSVKNTNENATQIGTPRQWVTKPTSIGNRTNDSIDLLLASHQRKKRILITSFAGIFLFSSAVLAYIFLAR